MKIGENQKKMKKKISIRLVFLKKIYVVFVDQDFSNFFGHGTQFLIILAYVTLSQTVVNQAYQVGMDFNFARCYQRITVTLIWNNNKKSKIL